MSAPRVLVVANPHEGERITRWLEEDGFAGVHRGDGSDDTLARFERDPTDVVVLCAGLSAGDALALAYAIRQRNAATAIVLVGEETGPVRTALDAVDFGADRFLRRPLSRAALRYAVSSCARLGHPAVADAPAGAVGSLVGEALAVPMTPLADTSTARHVSDLVAKIDVATTEAIQAFLHDVVESALSLPPGDPEDVEYGDELEAEDMTDFVQEDEVYAPEAALTAPRPEAEIWAASHAPPPAPELPEPSWREPTQILSDPLPRAPVEPPVAPEEARTGTFVHELRKHMSEVEERLFGSSDAADAASGTSSDDIDLDAIGVATIPGLGDPGLPHSMVIAPGAADSALGRETTARAGGPKAQITRGDLAVEDAAFIIGRLHRDGWSGRVTCRRGDAQKAMFFEEGRLVFATSNLPQDRMGDLLYREGKITREQHARSRELVAETGRRMGEILVEMGFLKRRELLPAVRRHVEDIVYSVFAWDSGAFVVAPGGGAEDEKIRLTTHPHALVIEGIRRKISRERLRQRVGSPQAVVTPFARDAILRVFEEADLSPEDREAAELFDGRRTLAQVVAGSRLDETAVYHLAYGLWALGLARVSGGREAAGTDSGVRAPAPAATPSGDRVATADLQIDRERILGKHAQVVEGDYFTVLGVRRDASAFEIRRAYEAMRREYDPGTLPADLQRELGAELSDIAVVLEEAQRILRSDPVRTQYLAHLAAE